MQKRLLAEDLYSYLVSLAALLKKNAEVEAAEKVIHVSRFMSGSTSELYGEARLLLPKVLEESGCKLSEIDRARLREIIAGIEHEFTRIGSA